LVGGGKRLRLGCGWFGARRLDGVGQTFDVMPFRNRNEVTVPTAMACAGRLALESRRRCRRADLPTQEPTVLRVVVNLKPAKALGLTIPQSRLLGSAFCSRDQCPPQ
jgi:hypothetical protein